MNNGPTDVPVDVMDDMTALQYLKARLPNEEERDRLELLRREAGLVEDAALLQLLGSLDHRLALFQHVMKQTAKQIVAESEKGLRAAATQGARRFMWSGALLALVVVAASLRFGFIYGRDAVLANQAEEFAQVLTAADVLMWLGSDDGQTMLRMRDSGQLEKILRCEGQDRDELPWSLHPIAGQKRCCVLLGGRRQGLVDRATVAGLVTLPFGTTPRLLLNLSVASGSAPARRPQRRGGGVSTCARRFLLLHNFRVRELGARLALGGGGRRNPAARVADRGGHHVLELGGAVEDRDVVGVRDRLEGAERARPVEGDQLHRVVRIGGVLVARTPLRVGVDQQHGLAALAERPGEVGAERGLARAALGVENREDHGSSVSVAAWMRRCARPVARGCQVGVFLPYCWQKSVKSASWSPAPAGRDSSLGDRLVW